MVMPTTTREFWKHKVYGEIYAVELLVPQGGGPREVIGARKCTRAEEQTRGALPVMQLYVGGDDAEFVSNNANDFGRWEPTMTRDDAVEKLREKITERDAARSHYDKIRKDERAALKTLEKLDADVLAASRDVVSPPEPAPLIAISELADTNTATPPSPGELTAEDFDAAFGGDVNLADDDTGDDAQPEPPQE